MTKKKNNKEKVVVTSHPFEGLKNGDERFAKVQLTRKVNALLDGMPQAIEAIDEALMMDVVSVSQAIGQLKEALDKVDECLNQRQYSKASALGYKDVASEFIFLQRVLGGLSNGQCQKEKLIQDIAFKLKTPYEKILPFLDKRLKSSIPRDKNLPQLSEEEINKKFDEKLKQL